MTNDSTPTGSRGDRLADRDLAKHRRPRLIPARRSFIPNGLSSRTSQSRFRALLQHRAAHRPQTPNTDDLLIKLFGAPQGAGLVGPGAEDFERAAFVEAIACTTGVAQVIIEYADLYRLFGGAAARDLEEALESRIYSAEALEDAIEHIESRTDPIPIGSAGAKPDQAPTLAWFATPRQDADVVHHTLQAQRNPNLIALISGPWAYGPTHLIEADGPWKPPRRSIELLSPQQAVAKLTQGSAPEA